MTYLPNSSNTHKEAVKSLLWKIKNYDLGRESLDKISDFLDDKCNDGDLEKYFDTKHWKLENKRSK